MINEYSNTAFTVASADNGDFLHSYVRVYRGNQQLSWHSTTIQAVQSQPFVLTDSTLSVSTAQTELSHLVAWTTWNPPSASLVARTTRNPPPTSLVAWTTWNPPPTSLVARTTRNPPPTSLVARTTWNPPPTSLVRKTC